MLASRPAPALGGLLTASPARAGDAVEHSGAGWPRAMVQHVR